MKVVDLFGLRFSYRYFSYSLYKKVLLRESKRHTDRGVSSTTPVEYPPPPPPGYPPSQVWPGGYPRWGTPHWGTPPARSDGGYPRWGVPKVGYPLSGYPHWGTPWPGLTGGTWGGVPPTRVPPARYPPLGYPLSGQVWQGVPEVGYPHQVPPPGYPPGQVRWGVPKGDTPLRVPPGWTWLRYPPPDWTWLGYPPPPGVNRLKTLPSLVLRTRSVIIEVHIFHSEEIANQCFGGNDMYMKITMIFSLLKKNSFSLSSQHPASYK